MKKNLLYLLIILNIFNPVFSDDFDSLFDDIDLSGEEEELNPLTISGEINLEQSIPYNKIDNFSEPGLHNNFIINYSSENIEIVSDIDILINSNNAELKANESFIKTDIGFNTLRAGYIEYNWGFADNLNPTNNLNPKNYSNPLDIESIPSLSISTEHYFGDNSIEFVYIPVKNDPVYPGGALDLFPITAVEDENQSYEKTVLGTKINHYGSFDLAVSYIWTIDDYYSIKEFSIPTMDAIQKKQRIHNIGLSIKTIKGPLGIWLEGNYQNKEINNKIDWVVGFDSSFGSEDQGLINMQSFGSYIIEYKKDSMSDILNNSLQNSKSQLTIGFTGNIKYELFNSELKPELTGIYVNYIDEDYEIILKPEVIYSPLDSLNFKIGGSIALKELEDLSTLYAGIEYSW